MKKLGNIDFWRVVYRSFLFQSTWNYERMLNLGYCFCLLPFVKKISLKDEVRKNIVIRNLKFFNSNPYLSNFLVGVSLNLEERNLKTGGEVDFAKFERLKRRLSESLAVIGDQLLWARVRPLAAFIGFLVSLFWGLWGPVVFFVLFNYTQIYTRFKGVVVGYREGENVVKKLDFKKFNKMSEYMFYFGAFLTGFALVMVPASQSYKDVAGILIFASSAVLMFFLLRFRITVPISLIILIFFGIFTGAIIQ